MEEKKCRIDMFFYVDYTMKNGNKSRNMQKMSCFLCFKFELIAFCEAKKNPNYSVDPNHSNTYKNTQINCDASANKNQSESVILTHLNHSISRMTSDITLFNTLQTFLDFNFFFISYIFCAIDGLVRVALF